MRQLIISTTPLGFWWWCVARLRFATDPNIAGTEKLAVAEKPSTLTNPMPALRATDISDEAKGFLDPMACFHVKGWTRSRCALTVLLHCYENPDVLQAGVRMKLMRFSRFGPTA